MDDMLRTTDMITVHIVGRGTKAALRLFADDIACTSMIICIGMIICTTTGARRSNARSVTMPPFNFRSFMRGCLMGTRILLGLWVLGAVAVWLLWRFMFSSWW